MGLLPFALSAVALAVFIDAAFEVADAVSGIGRNGAWNAVLSAAYAVQVLLFAALSGAVFITAATLF